MSSSLPVFVLSVGSVMYTVSINVYMVYDRPVVHGNDTFNTFLSAFGLAASEADPCVYLYQSGTDFFIVALWVDDRLLICNNSILSYLKTKFVITPKTADRFVGLHITRDRVN
jgi:hypothetical protein